MTLRAGNPRWVPAFTQHSIDCVPDSTDHRIATECVLMAQGFMMAETSEVRQPLGKSAVVVKIETQNNKPEIKKIEPERVRIKHLKDQVTWKFEGLPKNYRVRIGNGSYGAPSGCKPLKDRPFKEELVGSPGQLELESGPTHKDHIPDPGDEWKQAWSYKIELVEVGSSKSAASADPWVIVEKP